MSTILDKIVSDRERYSCDVKTLGECKLPSPVAHRRCVDDGERVFATENETYAKFAATRLGHQPTFERAGPKAKIFHDPSWTRVGIVTAGGLCPGLNTVIKGIVEILGFDYGVNKVFGIRYGYAGLNPQYGYEPVLLDADAVDTIHDVGGTVLGSSRGQQPADVMVDTLERMNINILFCIGGDGSLRCASDIAAEVLRRGLKISVVGIPKTIDNDLMFVGRSFGFESAVAEAAEVLRSAHVEAKGTPHGIGLVKLMGRDSGFIAAAATVANPIVNFCLVPEVRFEMDGERGLLAALERRFAAGKSHAVIVVAEGAGQELMEGVEERDPSGNVLKKDIGDFLKRRISAHFKAKGFDASVKYIDPSYTIRSCPAKGTDAMRCYGLARAAVHAAMAGRTDCVVGNIGESFALVPISLATIERQKLDADGLVWRSVLDATRQEFYFDAKPRRVFSGDVFAP
ncbi:MAG: ATP-dependent 6-phosphofructokinase [Kiritimatiellae bacterium]|nr:ATP-dependent 6-phosphofructokinase [Kiritimatiellia bacterium]